MSQYDIIEGHSRELDHWIMHTSHVLKHGSSTYESFELVNKEDKTHGALKHTRFNQKEECK